MPVTIYLVRHGSTAMNSDEKGKDRIRGWENIPLNEQGQEDAYRTSNKLRNAGFKTIVSSDLDRAADTANIIAENHPGATRIFTEKLRPWNLGKMQGSSSASPETLKRIQDHVENPDKCVPGGECFNDFKQRALDGLSDAADMEHPVAVVTHHRVERLLNAWNKTGQDNPDIDQDELLQRGEKPGSVQEVELTHYPNSGQPIGDVLVKTHRRSLANMVR
jgi:phosphoserine phosphatase